MRDSQKTITRLVLNWLGRLHERPMITGSFSAQQKNKRGISRDKRFKKFQGL
jgi:hypothetical protein